MVESLKADDSSLVVKPKLNFSQNFTVKNYKTKDGVSFRFFEEGQELEVEGPFGLGLCPEPDQEYVAFAGGTGVLTFMDLVARIAKNNLGLQAISGNLGSSEDGLFSDE